MNSNSETVSDASIVFIMSVVKGNIVEYYSSRLDVVSIKLHSESLVMILDSVVCVRARMFVPCTVDIRGSRGDQ